MVLILRKETWKINKSYWSLRLMSVTKTSGSKQSDNRTVCGDPYCADV